MSVNLQHKFEITLSIRETDVTGTNDDNKMTYTITSSPSKPTSCPSSSSISSPRRIKSTHSNGLRSEDCSISNDFTDKEILSIDNNEKFIDSNQPVRQTYGSEDFFNLPIDYNDNTDMMNFPWIDMGTDSRQSLSLPTPLPIHDFHPDQIVGKECSKTEDFIRQQDPHDYYDDDFDDESRHTAAPTTGQKQIHVATSTAPDPSDEYDDDFDDESRHTAAFSAEQNNIHAPTSTAINQSISGDRYLTAETNHSNSSSSKYPHKLNLLTKGDNDYDTNSVRSHNKQFSDTRGVFASTKHQYEYDNNSSDHHEGSAGSNSQGVGSNSHLQEYDKSGNNFDFLENGIVSDDQQHNELYSDKLDVVSNQNINLCENLQEYNDHDLHEAEKNHEGSMLRNSSWSSASEQPVAVLFPRCSTVSKNKIKITKGSKKVLKNKIFPEDILKNEKHTRKEVDYSYLKPALSKNPESASIRAQNRKKSEGNILAYGGEYSSGEEEDSSKIHANIQSAEEKERMRREDNLFRRTRGNEPLFAGLRALRLTSPAVEVRQSVLSGSATKRSPFSLKKEEPTFKSAKLTLSAVISLNNSSAKVKKKKKDLLF